jgi:protein-S-isoprenylcysteine O-methyltransferase Ste14
MPHQHRDNLAGEHRLSDIGQITLYCLFMALWLSDMFLGYSNFLNEYVPSLIRSPIGVLLLILAGYMAGTGLSIMFGKKAGPQGVIRKGVFRFVRHPIYLSEVILYLALLLLNISLAAALIWVIAIFFLHYISRYEEKLLLARFGDEYKQYMKEVPMWFPRLYRSR